MHIQPTMIIDDDNFVTTCQNVCCFLNYNSNGSKCNVVHWVNHCPTSRVGPMLAHVVLNFQKLKNYFELFKIKHCTSLVE